jgi:hypothetical protein
LIPKHIMLSRQQNCWRTAASGIKS